MIPTLVLIKTITSRKIIFLWKKKILIGLNEKCDIVINHPIFLRKSYLLDKSANKNLKSEERNVWYKNILSFQDLNGDQLLIRMVYLNWLIFGVLILFAIAVIFWGIFNHWRSTNLIQDWTAIPLPANMTYGLCRQDSKHPEGVRFIFSTSKPGMHDLVFTAGSGKKETVLTIFVNGNKLPLNLPLTIGWGKEISILLPEKVTKIGPNLIEFKIRHTSIKPVNWGIRNIRILSKPTSNNKNNHLTIMDKINIAMQQKEIGGQELSRLYSIITEMQCKESANEIDREIVSLKKNIENRMETILRNSLVQLKAARVIKDEKTSLEILRTIKIWLPKNWIKGLEIMNESGL